MVQVYPCLAQESGERHELRIRVLAHSELEISPLPGAVVRDTLSGQVTTSGPDGWASFSLQSGRHVFELRFAGYEPKWVTVGISKDTSFQVQLNALQMEEVVIKDKESQKAIDRARLSVESLSMEEAKEVVQFLGEADIIRTLRLKPGISNAGEAVTGLFVRGGGPDQNLFLMDEAILYNPNHLFGFFSVFNSAAIASADVYKSGFPARYGGRLSSVVDIETASGNKDSLLFEGGLGVLASRFAVEGPLQKGKSSFLVAGRRTYFDIGTRAWNRYNRNDPDYEDIPSYNFYDLNAHLDFQLNKKHQLEATGYFGRDNFSFTDPFFRFRFDWGNVAGMLTHTFAPNDRTLMQNTAYVSNYQYDISINNYGLQEFSVGAGITDAGLKNSWEYFFNDQTTLSLGLENSLKRYNVGQIAIESETDQNQFTNHEVLQATTHHAYASLSHQFNPRLRVETGLRFSSMYRAGDFMQGWEPRLAGKYALRDNLIAKAGYSKMYQYTHLASSSGASLPTDIWYPSSKGIRPQVSDQLAGGLEWFFGPENTYALSNEYYYKWMDQLIDFRNGADLTNATDLEGEFTNGIGRAYGMEWALKKQKGKLHGWIAYTLSWTWRKFDQINSGAWFHPRYDQRHDLSVVLIYEPNPRWEFSATWVYGSGTLQTLPTGFFAHQDVQGTTNVPPGVEFIPIYEQRNNYRLRPYHRSDLGVTYTFVHSKWESKLNLSVYNLYNRRNPFFVYFEEVQRPEDDDLEGLITGVQAKEVSLFPLLPSLTYSFKW